MIYYVFDGTYPGFLCVIFESFERKEYEITPIREATNAHLLLGTQHHVYTHPEKAKRVLVGIQNNLGKAKAIQFYHAFLSEDPKIDSILFALLKRIFTGQKGILQNYGDADVLYFQQTLKKISRERHRMKAFVRFSKSTDGLYVSTIEPDFDVLPLLLNFFKNRFTDQSWLIYDIKRNYGWLYDQKKLSPVELIPESISTKSADPSPLLPLKNYIDPMDQKIQNLWKQYFKSTNIEARKNLKLHLKHVPKRYWKYLVEK